MCMSERDRNRVLENFLLLYTKILPKVLIIMKINIESECLGSDISNQHFFSAESHLSHTRLRNKTDR